MILLGAVGQDNVESFSEKRKHSAVTKFRLEGMSERPHFTRKISMRVKVSMPNSENICASLLKNWLTARV